MTSRSCTFSGVAALRFLPVALCVLSEYVGAGVSLRSRGFRLRAPLCWLRQEARACPVLAFPLVICLRALSRFVAGCLVFVGAGWLCFALLFGVSRLDSALMSGIHPHLGREPRVHRWPGADAVPCSAMTRPTMR